MNKPTLSDLRAFMAVAEHRSFRRAADLLGITRSTLSHAVRGLEDSVGARLLHRTTRSVSLTEAGERLLGRLDPLMSDLDAALEEVAGEQGHTTGTLRINGGENAIRLLLQTVVPEFLARYPGVELDLVADGRLVDIVQQGFDAGVRLGEAVPKDMVAVRLGPDMRFLAVASPEYLAAHPAPKTPDALMQHQCIRQRLPSGKRYRWEFLKRRQEVAIDVPGALTLDNNRRSRDEWARYRVCSGTLCACGIARWATRSGAGGLVPDDSWPVSLLSAHPPYVDELAGVHRHGAGGYRMSSLSQTATAMVI
jgi:DNA-binding transcriptional LysR family regulator